MSHNDYSTSPSVGSVAPLTPRRVTRVRKSYSCHSCRARRVGCDKVHPSCGRCLRERKVCEYDRRSSNKATEQNASKSSNSVRLPVVGGDPEVLQAHLASHDYPQVLFGSEDREPFPTDGESMNSHPKKDEWLSGSQTSNSSMRIPNEIVPGLGFLSSQNGGKSRYVGPTFWAYVGEEDTELDSLLQEQKDYSRPAATDLFSTVTCQCRPTCTCLHQLNRNSESYRESGKVESSRNEYQYVSSLPKLLDDLPPREAADTLYQSFITSIHALLPLLHLKSFHQQYTEFWDWVDGRENNAAPTGVVGQNPSFLPLLFAILFAGSVGCSNDVLQVQFGSAGRLAISSKFYNSYTHTNALVAFPRNPTLYSLIAFLTVQNLLVREEEPLASCSYIGIALRVAQAMGLHRDGTNFGLSPIETEVRRRVWWHILHTDVMTSMPSALPPSLLTATTFDSKMISELKDDYLGTLDSHLYQDELSSQVNSFPKGYSHGLLPIPAALYNTSKLDIHLMVTVDRYNISSFMRQILHRQFAIEPITTDEFYRLKGLVDEMKDRISTRIEQLHQICEQDQFHGKSEKTRLEDKSFSQWSRMLLQLMVDKTYGILYQPLVRESNHYMWLQVRQDCIQHCQSYIRLFIQICTSSPFQPFHWLYPGLYQPLHAAATILSDLLKAPKSSEAERSRALIDKLFSMISPHDGIVSVDNGILAERRLSEGGREAWALIRRLRRKAWRRMGLDPDILWSSDLLWEMDPSVTANHIPKDASKEVRLETDHLMGSTLQSTSPSYSHGLSSFAEVTDTDMSSTGMVALEDGTNNTQFGSPAFGNRPGHGHSDENYLSDMGSPQFDWAEWDAAMVGTLNPPMLQDLSTFL